MERTQHGNEGPVHPRVGITAAQETHLIDQDQRVTRLRALQTLHELPRHRSQIGSPVTLDLRHVVHSTHAEAIEFPVGERSKGVNSHGT